MLTIEELQTKLESLTQQLEKSSADYAKARQALEQQLANHNALEGAVMLTKQMIEEEKAKEPIPVVE